MTNKQTIRNIILFTIVVILSGWIGILIDKVIPEQPDGDSLGMGIWLVLPLLASILLILPRSFLVFCFSSLSKTFLKSQSGGGILPPN